MHGFSSSDRNVYRGYGAKAFAQVGTNGRQFNYKDECPHDPESCQGRAWIDGWRDAWLASMGMTLEAARALVEPARV